jgi:hypothetical protein
MPDWTDYPVGIESAVVAGERLSERAIALGSQSVERRSAADES